MLRRILFINFMMITIGLLFGSCVPKKRLLSAQDAIRQLQMDSAQMASRISTLERNVNRLQDNST